MCLKYSLKIIIHSQSTSTTLRIESEAICYRGSGRLPSFGLPPLPTSWTNKCIITIRTTLQNVTITHVKWKCNAVKAHAGSLLLLLMIIAIRAWPNSHSNINSRFVLMVFVAHFIRSLRTLTQMASVCTTVPGETDKAGSADVLTTSRLNCPCGALENSRAA